MSTSAFTFAVPSNFTSKDNIKPAALGTPPGLTGFIYANQYNESLARIALSCGKDTAGLTVAFARNAFYNHSNDPNVKAVMKKLLCDMMESDPDFKTRVIRQFIEDNKDDLIPQKHDEVSWASSESSELSDNDLVDYEHLTSDDGTDVKPCDKHIKLKEMENLCELSHYDLCGLPNPPKMICTADREEGFRFCRFHNQWVRIMNARKQDGAPFSIDSSKNQAKVPVYADRKWRFEVDEKDWFESKK